MGKHAYLILAHCDFEVLSRLLSALDDKRNDIYIHYDKKVESCPVFHLVNARLFILEDRIDVRWGDVSMLYAEYALFETASNNEAYVYYHVLSGVDMPLKSQDDIHGFFNLHRGKEFVGFSQGDIYKELERKVCVYNLFPKHFRNSGSFCSLIIGFIRRSFIQIQLVFRFRRYSVDKFKKGPQWISITDNLVKYLISKKEETLGRYQYSFCSDEIFVQSACWNSDFYNHVHDTDDPYKGSGRIIQWRDNRIINWSYEDYDFLISSEAIFARKFDSDNLDIVDRILETIKN